MLAIPSAPEMEVGKMAAPDNLIKALDPISIQKPEVMKHLLLKLYGWHRYAHSSGQ
jgi:hypothetical protein